MRLSYAALFGCGMLTASLQVIGVVPRGSDTTRSAFATILLVFAAIRFTWIYSFWPIPVLGGVFYLIANGCSLFGLLNTRAAHRLGHISYGIYILQCLVLAAVFQLTGHWVITSPWVNLGAQTVATALLVVVALVTHRLVELPGMRLGNAIIGRVAPRRAEILPYGR